jgi:4-hydroxy-tetrahydrodipicolinate reductase|tara:strand:- start:243 stop:965 length:723 start_codon:yes stop_codon:yes gene_type:complete
MNIALIGYGKMGKTIEKLALERGHTIATIIDSSDFNIQELDESDVAIEFTQPDAAVANIHKCFEANTPIIVGTTGWYEHYTQLADLALKNNKGLFTATNFSVGVNILFHMNERLANIMNGFPDYEVSMTETHHLQKLDHPSGTAVTLAEGILDSIDRKKKYVGLLEGEKAKLTPFDLQILSKRAPDVAGFHQVTYESTIDEITLIHNAKSRLGFAQGAMLAAEWMQGKKGVYTMKELLNF